VLCRHPAVARIAILGAPDDKSGEEVLACIVPSLNYLTDIELARSIFDYCNQNLAYFKAPGWILFLDELPMTATHKVSKSQIFAPGQDPLSHPGLIDLRAMKKRR